MSVQREGYERNDMKIINFGSLNIDKVYEVADFVTAQETISAKTLNIFAGGKGLNQSIAAARAGAEVMHVGAIGSDGDFLLELLKESGADISQIQKLDEESGHAIIQVTPAGQNCIIIYGGTNQMLTKEQIDQTLDLSEPQDIILLQNETNYLGYIMEQAVERRLRIALNPSPISETLLTLPLDKAEWLLLNEVEGKILAGMKKNAPVDNEGVLSALHEKYPNVRLVLTVGQDGVLYQDHMCRAAHPIFRVKTVDTTAAGDTFGGYFLACVSEGRDVSDCLRIASAAAALAVSRKGAVPSIPKRYEVAKFLGNF